MGDKGFSGPCGYVYTFKGLSPHDEAFHSLLDLQEDFGVHLFNPAEA